MDGGGHIYTRWMKLECMIVIFAADLQVHSAQGDEMGLGVFP